MGKYANLFKDDFVFQAAVPEKTEGGGEYANLFNDNFVFRQPLPQKAKEEEAEYSTIRSALVDFVESAVGAGDELDATVRLLSGEADDWASAIGQSRRELSAFEKDNPTASKSITALGFGAALFIPGAGLAKIAQAGTKVDRALKAAGLTAAEGSAYGFLSGEGEEGRLTGAAFGAAAGGVLGGASGAFLTKNADEIKEAAAKAKAELSGEGTHIGGSGFKDVGLVSQVGKGPGSDTSALDKTVKSIDEKAVAEAQELPATGQSGFFGNIFLSTKEWIVKNVGERAARLAEDSEIMIRYDQQAIEKTFESDIYVRAMKLFEENKGLKAAVLRMNPAIEKKSRMTWIKLSKLAKTPEEKEIIEHLRQQVKQLQEADLLKHQNVSYFPSKTIHALKKVTKASPDDYHNPIVALKEFAEDVSAARMLAQRFEIDPSKIKRKKGEKNVNRLKKVITEIGNAAGDQGATPAVSGNLENGLRSLLIASKQGGDTLGAVGRRTTSAALLANPMNAVLNIIEGVTAPIFQNGVKAWAQSVPTAILATFNKNLGIEAGWVSNKVLGLDREFMGEVANTSSKAFAEAAEVAQWTVLGTKRGGRGFVEGTDALGKTLYKYSGTGTVNRMGQEILANSAVKRGFNLSKDGSEKSLAKLREHDGMRGLTEKEFQQTVEALKAKDLSSPWVLNFAGASMNKWQPVSASALPKAFHDNPNGRMAYSMLSYMNKQMNSLRTDVGLNILKVRDKGINTPEGAKALKDAMLNSGKYAALFGVVAGVWDDARKTLDLSRDRNMEELLTPEGISSAAWNQIWSNVSSGIVDIRAEEYGGSPVEVYPAPIRAAVDLGGGLFNIPKRAVLGEEEPFTPALRAVQNYVPGVANIDRISRMTFGKRLFEDLYD